MLSMLVYVFVFVAQSLISNFLTYKITAYNFKQKAENKKMTVTI